MNESTCPVPLSEFTHQNPDIRRLNAQKDLYGLWLVGLKEKTKRAYKWAGRSFLAFLTNRTVEEVGVEELPDFLWQFIGKGPGLATAMVEGWKGHMIESGKLSPNSINLNLAGIRSYVRKARKLHLINWTLEVEGVPAQTYKDTRGPSLEKLRLMMNAARSHRSPIKAIRDEAILRLMFDCGLRRAEVVGLNIGDFDPEEGSLEILGKGRIEKEKRPLSPQGVESLRRYLNLRGNPDPELPLFMRIPTAGKPHGALTHDGLYYLVQSLAKRSGIGKCRPHAIRHSSITALLDHNGGNIREGQAFSRHSSPEILNQYDDGRKDTVGKSTRLLAALLP